MNFEVTPSRSNLSAGTLFQGIVLLTFLLLFNTGNHAHAASVTVRTESELQTAVRNANGSGGNVTINVADGTYTLTDTLYINAAGITLSGASADRSAVIIQGDAMSDSASIGNLIRVAADNFTLQHITLQKAGYHLIQIAGERNADSPVIRDCILRDAYQQLVKVSVNSSDLSTASDNGVVENCIFEYTAGIGPNWYIGGLDAHAATNWIVRNNTFLSIVSPHTAVAEYAVHFWNGSADNLVEQNLIINCDRGIGFGLNSRDNKRGIIRNNMIYHVANLGQYADVGISVQNSSGTEIYNNTVFMEHSYPNAIEARFSGSSGVGIRNNLTNRSIVLFDGASGTKEANVTSASAGYFLDPAAGDLHLESSNSTIVDKGVDIAGLSHDFDGESRPVGGGIDIGADEYGAVAKAPNPPTNLDAI